MSIFFCQNHNKKHESSDWSGKAVDTEKGVKIQYHCLAYSESRYPEFLPQKFHEERVTYANDMLQSHRGGQLSKEFIEAHPKRAKQMLKAGAITKEEVKNSKYVWRGDVKGVTKKVDAEALIK